MSGILIFIIILIIIICFIVGSQLREGFTCGNSQVPVFDMKLYTYNCMSSLNSVLPTCSKDQTVIINAPDKTYKCGTIYGDPLINNCSINTNDPTNYLITCDGYSSSINDDSVNRNNYYYDDDGEIVVEDETTYPSTTLNANSPTSTSTSNDTYDSNIQTKDYTPFIYPTFAPPPCNLISKLIIKPKPETPVVNTTATSQQNSTPQTRMTDNTKKEYKSENKTYTYESIPFPYLPAFKTF